MAVMALFRSNRVDRAQYDAIMRELELDQGPAAGGVIHTCGFDADGIYVLDVWESRAEFDAFLKDRLLPVFAKLKIDVEPPLVLDTYGLRVSDVADRYKLAHTAA
jgi:hypothetical protein